MSATTCGSATATWCGACVRFHVIYNGRRRWNAPADVSELIASGGAALARYQPSQRYFLLDEGRVGDAALPGGWAIVGNATKGRNRFGVRRRACQRWRRCGTVTHLDMQERDSVSRRVNIMMDDDAWRVIEQLPRGARSRAINTAIREWSGASARRNAAARMDSLRARLPPVATEDVVRWVREDRERRPS